MKTKRQHSISRLFIYAATTFTFFSSVIFGLMVVNEKYAEFRLSSEKIHNEFLLQKKALVRTEVEKALSYIEFSRSRTELRLKEELQSRTNEAYAMSMSLYSIHEGEKSREEIQQIIHDALRSVQWDSGRGYYFAESMAGVEMVNRNNPELEGVNIIDLQDDTGKYLVREIIAVAKEKGAGFCSYHWNKPGEPGVLRPKFSYVKYFEPLDWVIGTGKYMDEVEEEVKQEVLLRLEDVRFGEGGYLFIGQWNGLIMSKPAKGKNMLGVTDPNGVKIVQELIKAAKSGGDFVEYVMPNIDSQRQVPKISYSSQVKEWEWFVGAGIYLEEIDDLIVAEQAKLKQNIKKYLFRTFMVFFAVVLVALMVARYVSARIKLNMESFFDFFKKAVSQSAKIEQNSIYFSEFRMLAQSANLMIEEKRELEARLRHAQKMEAIGTLAGGIAHDFNNILTPIIGYSEISLMMVDKDDDIAQNLQEIKKAANRAKDLVQQILVLSRHKEKITSPLQIQLIVKEVIKLIRSTIPANIEIQQQIDPESKLVMADSTKIHQVVMNLATNAFHAMEDGNGVLTITLKNVIYGEDSAAPHVVPGCYVELTVSDTGCGIEPAIVERIFEPYFTTKDIGKGTGLGLAVIKGIVDSYNGYIEVSSERGEGTTVQVCLPAIEEKAVSEREAQGPLIGGSERILLVDDEEAIVGLYKETLGRLGYKVTAFCNSEEMFETFQASPDSFDLVITDQSMPHLSGSELAKKILKIRPDIPIILCTGFSSIVSEPQAREIGIDQFIMKPINQKELALAIREGLDKGKASAVTTTPGN